MNEVRLIDANALIEEFKKHEDRNGYLKADWEVLIGNAPTVNITALCPVDFPTIDDPYPCCSYKRPQGEWIPEENTFTDLNGIIETYTRFKCSICNQGQNFGEYPFCCWCGAEMRGKKE